LWRGTGTHILAGTLGSKENFIVNVFTRNPQKWTKKITVQIPNEKKEVVGKINIVSSNPKEVFKDCDIFICNDPAMANPIYLKAMEPYLKDGAIIGSIFGQGGFDFAVLDIVGGRKEFEKRKLKVFSLKGIPWVCRTLEYGKSAKIVGKKARLQMAAIPKIKGIENESNYHPQRRWLVLIVLKGTLLLVYLNRLSCFCSISFSFCSCHFTYSLICFSFRPTVLTQYPRLHKCRPQYRFPNLSYR